MGPTDAPLLIPTDRAEYVGAIIFLGGIPGIRLRFSDDPIFKRGWTGSEAGPELVGGRLSPTDCKEWLELELESVASPCKSF